MKSYKKSEMLELKKICHHCIGEDFLSNEVRHSGKRRICSYCGKKTKSFTLDEISERVETAFAQHYIRTSDQPNSYQYALLADKESDYEWNREGNQTVYAIQYALDINDQAAEDIQQILEIKYREYDPSAPIEETEFDAEAHYESKRPGDNKWQEQWSYFETSLKTQTRFFNRDAIEYLTSIFKDVDQLSTPNGRTVAIQAGPGTELTTFFRARVFQSEDKLTEALCRPDRHLGPPPTTHATAGRMNAQGISVFYGSTDQGTAIAEVRPPVGSSVAAAKFKILSPLLLIDLEALNSVEEHGSIFDVTWASRLEKMCFLRTLTQRIIKPVMPNDEPSEYLVTQAIADFLATENNPTVDGILFPSVQTGHSVSNVVLFHKSSQVAPLDYTDDTEIIAHTGYQDEDEWHDDYTVFERAKNITKEHKIDFESIFTDFDDVDHNISYANSEKSNNPTLDIDTESITVNIIRGTQFQYDTHKVHRHKLHSNTPEL